MAVEEHIVASGRSGYPAGVQSGVGWPRGALTPLAGAHSPLGWPGTTKGDEAVAVAGRGATPEGRSSTGLPMMVPAQPTAETVTSETSTAIAPHLSVGVAAPPLVGAAALSVVGAPAVPAEVSRETDSSASLSARRVAAADPVSRETSVGAGSDSDDLTTTGTPVRGAGSPEDATPLATAVEYTLRLRDELHDKRPFPRPKRTRVMVVANQKGGVGKTTTTVNVAATLAEHGLRVLVIDLDPQGNASTALGIEHRRGTPSSYDALVDGTPLGEIAQESAEAPGLLVVPATIDLAGAEIELVSVVARENRLRKAVHGFDRVFAEDEDRIDYVLIDCPPSLGLLTLNALVAADELLLPIQTEYYALEGVGQLLETVELVRANLNPGLWISTVLLTMYDARTRLSAGVAEEVRQHFGDRVLRTAIPRSVRVSEAPSHGRTVMTYDPASPGALSYLEAARELTTGEQS
jgi:chromosome partitioning protein